MALPVSPLTLDPHRDARDARAASARAFADLDERLASGQAGWIGIRAAADAHAPLLAHAARRLRVAGWSPIEASARAGAPLFREVATHLGIGELPSDAGQCAELLAGGLVGKRVAVVAGAPREGSWDHAVATELHRLGRTLVVFAYSSSGPVSTGAGISSLSGAPAPGGASAESAMFDIGQELGPAERVRWLGAIAEEAAQSEIGAQSLRAIETWWARARHLSSLEGPSATALEGDERTVLAVLALAGRTLPLALLSAVTGAPAAAAGSLVARGLVVESAAGLGVSPLVDADAVIASASIHDRRAAAAILRGEGRQGADDPARSVTVALAGARGPGFDPDPWAFARAAELLVSIGETMDADASIHEALRRLEDAHAQQEIAGRWFAAVLPITGESGLALRVRAAERALALGEAAEAQRWCESATTLAPGDPSIALLLGRALLLLGDLVAARVSLNKAAAGATDDELKARVSSVLAEVSYVAGDLPAASEHAKAAVARAKSPSTRLAGRNTLGKILLAGAQWDEADAHFAEDSLFASSARDAESELRARLNRGITVLSKGKLEEARGILERVLQDGEAAREDRACAHALNNLAIIAYRQHDYARALASWEAAVRFPPALCGRLVAARTLANLADLRRRLGLIEHAEHTIAFGRRVLGGRSALGATAHFGIVAAHVALARGNSTLARREIDAAIADAEAAGERGHHLPEAQIVSARVGLDDGDLARAEDAIVQAERVVSTERGRAEIAMLRALLLRAHGRPALEMANTALHGARASGDEDMLLDVYALLATLHRDAGEVELAASYCARAIALRDQIVGTLPTDIRVAFLAKAELLALSRLQSTLAVPESQSGLEDDAPRTRRAPLPLPTKGREIVGDDPAIRGLLVAIRKVARSNSTVLIRGESGTGKELVAEALHRASERAGGPLVSVNCAALVETLLLSELFGHEKGAFTGASARRRGRFEMAEGGTLFLDEIGDISARTQVALLRVLQERTFERVGGTTPIQANVRVICATHRDLRAMVERGEFREDLYYRLRGITLEVPALRSRIGDLPKIAEHLLVRIGEERRETPKRLAPEAIDLLQRHRWPGNIRELENVLRAVSLFAEGDAITGTDLVDNVDDLRALAVGGAGPTSQGPLSLRNPLALASDSRPSAPPPAPSASASEDATTDEEDESAPALLPEEEANATAVAYVQVRQGAVSLADMKRQIERDCIARALVETKGNITRAAALLGMKRPRLSQLVKQYGLSASSSEGNP